MTQIDEVKSRLDIVDLVGGYVTLQRSGSSFKANCPFHQERTPSFYVFPDRQSWRCFGACAEGGDAFGFVMKAERVDFREALHRLAARAGVTLANPAEGGGRTRPLYDINDAARLFTSSSWRFRRRSLCAIISSSGGLRSVRGRYLSSGTARRGATVFWRISRNWATRRGQVEGSRAGAADGRGTLL